MRLDLRKFRAWLSAKEPSTIVGKSRDCHACPLAMFYEEMSGGSEVVISNSGFHGELTIDRGFGDRRLPAWAERFAFDVDGTGLDEITAAQAIQLLPSPESSTP